MECQINTPSFLFVFLFFSFSFFSPPVPALSLTVQRYLNSMEPLLDPYEFERLQRLGLSPRNPAKLFFFFFFFFHFRFSCWLKAEDFAQNQGFWLQILLIIKSWLVPNYVTDWWERFVYLRWREPMMINSNYYIMDARDWRPTNNQVKRGKKEKKKRNKKRGGKRGTFLKICPSHRSQK
jgi:hypothetical protein